MLIPTGMPSRAATTPGGIVLDVAVSPDDSTESRISAWDVVLLIPLGLVFAFVTLGILMGKGIRDRRCLRNDSGRGYGRAANAKSAIKLSFLRLNVIRNRPRYLDAPVNPMSNVDRNLNLNDAYGSTLGDRIAAGWPIWLATATAFLLALAYAVIW